MGSWKNGWKIYFRCSSSPEKQQTPPPEPPKTATKPPPPSDLLCPISGSLMSDPVILPSGLTFDRPYLQACLDLRYSPTLSDGSRLPINTLNSMIPNLAIKSTIDRWCDSSSIQRPQIVDPDHARGFVRKLMVCSNGLSDSDRHHCSSTASVTSSSPSSVDETLTLESTALEEEIVAKLRDARISMQEEGLVQLRTVTRESPEKRISLCTPRLLSAVRPMLLSRYSTIQIHASASLVNLSLEPRNRPRIVRSGAVPPLIDAMRCGNPEAEEHAAAAVFGLSADESGRAAIGVLGAIEPLVRLIGRPGTTERGRRDAVHALHQLALAETNRAKIARCPGAVRTVLDVARDGEPTAPMVLCALAGSADGVAALMDHNAVEVLIGIMDGCDDVCVKERCVAVMYGLSRWSILRFRAAMKGREDVLREAAEEGGWAKEKAREMARRMLSGIRWDGERSVSDTVVAFRRCGLVGVSAGAGSNSTDF
ncbi:U-box domain-containing protein 39 [Acorus gramineus]|uniref:RING-type E3 ubiquitin transferase n=1 Tax=Acorus gramineus TaxID=55184 RepID=A0AAV9BAG0_ACOGR|nr:U-box domain-containing protein 39 [Acorus gramineus]